ncbi:hypothetical protein OGM63_21855 [Plectonema radiosum NIES-515]|uniref:Uncharacterized protein n=1 Tax=Plectonema radiosum NIES-515 TaxID=2986073 RepID=A0ABT3B434_9CYAN|nr:hypothetical protein [Plectonema radiosum]MCV3216122.1 hypothetical protein [Plectonema radiosum NIES-515]
MKSLTRVFAAFLLAITIAFGGFSGNAHAQSPVGANVNVSIDANKTIEQILGLITSTQKFQMVIANQTGSPLTRVGGYNSLSNWVLGDVPPLTAQYRDWTENGAGYFTFASNYAVGNTGKFFQFGASWPPIGRRKINLCARNENGNSPANACWDAMTNADDKNLVNGQFTARAIMANNNGRVQWIYQVK